LCPSLVVILATCLAFEASKDLGIVMPVLLIAQG